MKDIRHALKKQSKEWLIDRLVELSVVDDANADRIRLSLVAEQEDEAKMTVNLKRQIDKAVKKIEDHGPGSWKSPLPTDAFDSVVDALTMVLSKNQRHVVIDTSEYALVRIDKLFELQDECELEYLVDAFRELHLESCRKLKPDPCALGTRFAELSRKTEWGFFDGPPDGYNDILGNAGLAAFQAGSNRQQQGASDRSRKS
jgi:hypothetical protein